VLWDGRVVPCCRDSDAALVLGDLTKQSLEEIWSGAEIKRLREQLRKSAVPCGHLCDGCAWSRESFATGMSTRHPDLVKTEPLYW
jgi:radical SAM protein with 4Fe4S-binding SPASM domain